MTKLEKYRKDASISIRAMAYNLGISKTYYFQIEKQERRLPYDLAIMIADIFKVTPDTLFYEDFLKLKKDC